MNNFGQPDNPPRKEEIPTCGALAPGSLTDVSHASLEPFELRIWGTLGNTLNGIARIHRSACNSQAALDRGWLWTSVGDLPRILDSAKMLFDRAVRIESPTAVDRFTVRMLYDAASSCVTLAEVFSPRMLPSRVLLALSAARNHVDGMAVRAPEILAVRSWPSLEVEYLALLSELPRAGLVQIDRKLTPWFVQAGLSSIFRLDRAWYESAGSREDDRLLLDGVLRVSHLVDAFGSPAHVEKVEYFAHSGMVLGKAGLIEDGRALYLNAREIAGVRDMPAYPWPS